MDRITFWAMMGTSYKSKLKPNESSEEKIINRKILLWQENLVYYNL